MVVPGDYRRKKPGDPALQREFYRTGGESRALCLIRDVGWLWNPQLRGQLSPGENPPNLRNEKADNSGAQKRENNDIGSPIEMVIEWGSILGKS